MKFFRLPETDEEKQRVPPKQRLAKGFPVLTVGKTPIVNSDNWHFEVWTGRTTKSWDYEALLALPSDEFKADFHCVTHWSKLDVEWRGVKVQYFLDTLDLKPAEKYVLVHCYGGYTTNLLLADLNRGFLAYELNHEPLSPDRGGPVRLVVPHLYAWKSAKWIRGVEVLTEEKLGYWEEKGYHRRGDPWEQERYSHP